MFDEYIQLFHVDMCQPSMTKTTPNLIWKIEILIIELLLNQNLPNISSPIKTPLDMTFDTPKIGISTLSNTKYAIEISNLTTEPLTAS
jgi:hypothetical protein